MKINVNEGVRVNTGSVYEPKWVEAKIIDKVALGDGRLNAVRRSFSLSILVQLAGNNEKIRVGLGRIRQ